MPSNNGKDYMKKKQGSDIKYCFNAWEVATCSEETIKSEKPETIGNISHHRNSRF